jgi:hypothetical protein
MGIDWKDIGVNDEMMPLNLHSEHVKELRDQILETDKGKFKKSHLRLSQLALDVADLLDKSQRQLTNAPPGTEEFIVIQLSDKTATAIAHTLRRTAQAND